MCLIIQVKDKAIGVTPEEFRTNLTKNQDGTGIMFANHGRVIVKKELDNVGKQVELFEKYTKSVTSGSIKELFVHSRFATHGDKDEFNCHPYQILTPQEGKELWCMHNGTIACERQDKNKSDTYHFLNNYLKPLLVNRVELLDNPFFIEMISKYIGTGSKLVFLDSTGKSTFVNKTQGVEYNEAWISNEYSGIRKPVATYKPTNYYGGRKNAYDDGDWDFYGKVPTKKPEIKVNENVCIMPVKNHKPIIKLNDKKKDQELDGEDTFEEKAVDHGLKLLIAACADMTREEVYNFVLAEPLVASEMLNELLDDTQIVIGL